jgi:monofunctional glycosyltransferase
MQRKRKRRLGRRLAIVILVAVLLSAFPVLILRWVAPPTTAFMLREQQHAIHFQWVALANISTHARLAVIASEDQLFAKHRGFDFKSMQKAMRNNAAGKNLRGASTISQQVAKNLFLWEGRSYTRKILEAWFTVLLETLWPKQRILETYLNVAELGPGIYGIEAAAQHYFGKSAARLNATQAATLAAVLPSPQRWRADRPSSYVRQRRTWILQQMRNLDGKAINASL